MPHPRVPFVSSVTRAAISAWRSISSSEAPWSRRLRSAGAVDDHSGKARAAASTARRAAPSPRLRTPPPACTCTAVSVLLLRRRYRQVRAARFVLLGETEEQVVESRAFLVGERIEEHGLTLAGDRAQSAERLLALGSQADEMPSPVLRVAPALDETALFELVEQADELAAVVAKGVGDRPLRLVRPLVERDQDRVVIGVKAGLLVGRHRLLFRRIAEPLQQERRGGDELLGEPRYRKRSRELRGCDSHVK